MFKVNEKFASANKSAMDTTMRFAQLALDSSESLMKLQMGAVRSTIEENLKAAKAVTEVKDPLELAAMQTKIAEGLVERATAYSRDVYEIASKAQSKMAKLAEESLNECNETATSAVETALKTTTPGSDAAANAFKSSMAVAAEAVETITKAAQQVTEITEAGLKAAANTVVQSINTATKKSA